MRHIPFPLLAISALLVGCAARSVVTERIGECLETVSEQGVWETRHAPAYMSDFMLTAYPVQSAPGPAIPKKVGDLPNGTKVVVHEFISGWNGTVGEFLRVRVRVLDGSFSGLIADIPACVPSHPKLKWISRCSLNPGEIEFDPKTVRKCIHRSGGNPRKAE